MTFEATIEKCHGLKSNSNKLFIFISRILKINRFFYQVIKKYKTSLKYILGVLEEAL